MLFHSPEFIALMLVTLVIYAAVPRARLIILAVANALFYGAAGWPYLALFLGLSLLTHLCALQVGKPHARLSLWLGLVGNLLNLGLFKYTGFAVANLSRLFGLGLNPAVWRLVLPVGISFYTFQLIAYLVDVHRGTVAPTRSFLKFWVFISFFGQLIAGPIMRADEFLPQVEALGEIRIRQSDLKEGAFLFTLGLTKKIFFSDLIGPKVDSLFAQAATLTGPEAWVAATLFAFQIYFDFSAYSEMALGVGRLFGLELAVNFRTPYLAANPEEFWRRWHITLSSWIRDYLYIPLGGSRRGEARAYLNLVLAMALSGLWHGAAWTFVVWGLIHGLLSAMHKFWHRRILKPLGVQLDGVAIRWLSIALMFAATTIAWVFFRAESLGQATLLVAKMLTPWAWRLSPVVLRYLPVLAALMLLHVGEFWLRERQDRLAALWHRWVPSPMRAFAYTVAAALLIIMVRLEESTFIYFRF